ncbi:MAG: 2-oxo acid dehydrogenase subunit E2 [Ignavibacteria bacterium]
MIKEVKLPEVSDNVETGDVLKVLVNVGDKVEVDQPLVELETEKATFEVPSTESGIIKEVNVKQGDVIKIGDVIIKVETNGGEEKTDEKSNDTEEKADKKTDENKKSEAEKKDSKEKDAKEDTEKSEGKEDNEKSDGKEVKKKEEPKEKADEEKYTGKNGKAKEDSPKVEKPKEEKSDKTQDTDKESKAKPEADVNAAVKDAAPASPSVRRLARELGVEINSVTGTGAAGRISEEDIKDYVRSRLQSGTNTGVVLKALPDFSKWGEVDIQPMNKIRTITGEALSYAWTTIPMVTQFDKTDITELEEFRKKQIKKSEDKAAHLTITSILVKVCEAAIRTFPQFNSSIDFNNKEIIYKKYFNIGVAVDTDRGLLVPVIKNVDTKKILEISGELNILAEKARNKKISPDEMEGGNFTISNLGGIGGTGFSPIVYSPQVAILGVSRGSIEPKYSGENFAPRMMLPLSLTYDHRIIDGADAARFLRWICEALENPMKLFL